MIGSKRQHPWGFVIAILVALAMLCVPFASVGMICCHDEPGQQMAGVSEMSGPSASMVSTVQTEDGSSRTSSAVPICQMQTCRSCCAGLPSAIVAPVTAWTRVAFPAERAPAVSGQVPLPPLTPPRNVA